jgi:hypothetical protein
VPPLIHPESTGATKDEGEERGVFPSPFVFFAF